MTSPSIEKQIESRVAAFTEELSELIREAALEAVAEALGTGARPRLKPRAKAKAKRNAAPAKRPKRGGKRIRRTAADLEKLTADVLSYVKSNQGQRLEEMSAGTGVTSHDLKRPIIMLLEQKALRKEGQKRGTRYFAGSKKRGK